jgi:hypothetical protein
MTYSNWTTGTPPAANFAFGNLQYCYPGDDTQCTDARKQLAGHMLRSKHMAPKQPKIVLKEF